MDDMDTSDLLAMSLDDILKQKKEINQIEKTKLKPKAKSAPLKKGGKRSPLVKKLRRSRPADRMEGRSDAVSKWEHDRHEAYEQAKEVDRPERRERRIVSREKSNVAGSGTGKGSILSRLGSAPASKIFGIQVSFSNLNEDVDIDDIKEVAMTAGQVNHVELVRNRSGRSTGRALVTYARFLDAKQAVENLHMRTLDGTPMQVEMAGSVGGARGIAESAASDFTSRSRNIISVRDLPVSKFSAMTLEREGALKHSASVIKGRGFQEMARTLDPSTDFRNKGPRRQRHSRAGVY